MYVRNFIHFRNDILGNIIIFTENNSPLHINLLHKYFLISYKDKPTVQQNRRKEKERVMGATFQENHICCATIFYTAFQFGINKKSFSIIFSPLHILRPWFVGTIMEDIDTISFHICKYFKNKVNNYFMLIIQFQYMSTKINAINNIVGIKIGFSREKRLSRTGVLRLIDKTVNYTYKGVFRVIRSWILNYSPYFYSNAHPVNP